MTKLFIKNINYNLSNYFFFNKMNFKDFLFPSFSTLIKIIKNWSLYYKYIGNIGLKKELI